MQQPILKADVTITLIRRMSVSCCGQWAFIEIPSDNCALFAGGLSGEFDIDKSVGYKVRD